jgi:hypothetical protein
MNPLEALRLRNSELRLLLVKRDFVITQLGRQLVNWKQTTIAALAKAAQLEDTKLAPNNPTDFNLQNAIDQQQQLVINLQAKANKGTEGATAELANAIAGLRSLYAIKIKPPVDPSSNPPVTGYHIR